MPIDDDDDDKNNSIKIVSSRWQGILAGTGLS